MIKNYKITEEQRKRMSEAHKGHNVSDKTRDKIRKSYYHSIGCKNNKMPIVKGMSLEQTFGKEKSEKIKEKISKTMKERGISPKIKLKVGYKMTEENKLKISKARIGKKFSEEHKNKLIETLKNKCWKTGWKHTNETKLKMGEIQKRLIKNGQKRLPPNGFKKGHKVMQEWKDKQKEWRMNYVLPKKDTTIEVKMQNFLKELSIEFYTHQYIKEIEHAYQCDILIPVQKGITKKTIIECNGDYWHKWPYGREIDVQRCKELREKGWRVLVFWECEIRPMELINLKERLNYG